MKLFIDTADVDFVRDWAEFCDGITTNPSLIAKEIERTGRSFKQIVKDLCSLVDGPVSVEVISDDQELMLQEAFTLAEIADNVCVKVPLTPDGLCVCRALQDNDIMVNVTLCFSVPQSLLAAASGASFISPFVGRLDDIGESGVALVHDIREAYNNEIEWRTLILAASIRSLDHITQVAKAGADAATIPPHLFEAMFTHPLTTQGLEKFAQDWKKTKQKII